MHFGDGPKFRERIAASMASDSGARKVRFGPFEADLQLRELRKHDVRLRLPDQAFLILKLLLEQNGGLVTREDLKALLWQGQMFVYFDHAVNVLVSRLRDALGDSAKNPQYIETVPKRGYRFLHPISPVIPKPVQDLEPPAPVPLVAPAATKPQWRWIAAIGLVALSAAAMISFRAGAVPGRVGDAPEAVYDPALRGTKDFPAVSHDGKEVAFVWQGDDPPVSDNASKRPRNLYVKLDRSEPVRLSRSSYDESFPAFSPTGREIAFLRNEPAGQFVDIIPVQGGKEAENLCSGSGPGMVARRQDVSHRRSARCGQSASYCAALPRDRREPPTDLCGMALDSFPSFRPTGKTLLFTRSVFVQDQIQAALRRKRDLTASLKAHSGNSR